MLFPGLFLRPRVGVCARAVFPARTRSFSPPAARAAEGLVFDVCVTGRGDLVAARCLGGRPRFRLVVQLFAVWAEAVAHQVDGVS